MYCEKCLAPMLPVWSKKDGWMAVCLKCGTQKQLNDATGLNVDAGEAAFRGFNYFSVQGFDSASENFRWAAKLDGLPGYIWALLLADYGVKYCRTSQGSGYTVNFWKEQFPSEPLSKSEAFAKVCDAAATEDAEILAYYQREAQEIDRGIQQIRRLAQEGVAYDVFLSFKDRDNHGNLTPERRLCEGLYRELADKGLRVFYAPRVMSGKVVSDFEGYIYTALRTSKLMVLAVSSEENVQSPWVRSEWRRFWKWNNGDASRLMTCTLGDMYKSSYPAQLRNIQHELHADAEKVEDTAVLQWFSRAIRERLEGLSTKPDNSKRKFPIAMLALVLLAIAVGMYLWITNNSHNKRDDPPDTHTPIIASTLEPAEEPISEPIEELTLVPTEESTPSPSLEPTPTPSPSPSPAPTPTPSPSPTSVPTPTPPPFVADGPSAVATKNVALVTAPYWSCMQIHTMTPDVRFVAISEEVTGETTWVYLEYGYNGKLWRGYAQKKFFEIDGELPKSKYLDEKLEITRKVRVYAAPSPQASLRGVLDADINVTAVAREGDYIYVKYYDAGMNQNARGYINRHALDGEMNEHFLQKGRYRVVNSVDDITLKTGPWGMTESIGKILPGTELELIEESSNGYARVIYNGIECYAPAAYLERIE